MTTKPLLTYTVLNFIRESNRIEDIRREPTTREFDEAIRFLNLSKVTVADLQQFVSIYQPNAVLRDKPGLDVAIGGRIPQRGGPEIRARLERLLTNAIQSPLIAPLHAPDPAFTTHVEYEHLHPFTDGNGRSGRMLWAWQLQRFPLGFLHTFYYQTLSAHTP